MKKMDFVKYILVLVVLFVDSEAGGHEESHHDHLNLHVPEFIHHDHHTKVITIHHHHKPKKEHHHHHHHHHQKPHILHGPPKYHHTHHHSKSSSHSVSKGHSTHLGQKNLGNHGLKGKQGHSGHHRHHGYKYHDAPASYDPPSVNYAPPSANYAPPSANYAPPSANYAPPSANYAPLVPHYNPSPSVGSDYGAFSSSVPDIPSQQVHGIVHTVQQVKVFDSLPGAFKTGGTGYEVREHGDEGEEDVFTSVNSLSHSYPGAYGPIRNAAGEQGFPFSDITHSDTNQSPKTDPFAAAQPQPNYANLEDFNIQSQSAHALPSVQPSYAELTGYDNADNSVTGIGNGLSGDSALAFAESAEDDTQVSFSREAGLEHAINAGGIETVAY